MNIVTTTSVFPNGHPAEDALIRLAKLGYTHLDLAFDYCVKPDYPFMQDNWKDWVLNLRRMADELGVSYTHSHACGDVKSRSTAMFRCLEACSMLGIQYIVAHPIHSIDGHAITDEDEFIRVNVEATKPLLEKAEENGVILLSENLLWGASRYPHVISRLVSEIHSPWFGWCYDSGHANCFGIRPSALIGLDNVPLSLHIQDNYGKGGDDHLLPGDGTIDWKEFLDTLKAIGYSGELVLEAHHQSIDAPDEQRESILADLLERSKKMRTYLDQHE